MERVGAGKRLSAKEPTAGWSGKSCAETFGAIGEDLAIPLKHLLPVGAPVGDVVQLKILMR